MPISYVGCTGTCYWLLDRGLQRGVRLGAGCTVQHVHVHVHVVYEVRYARRVLAVALGCRAYVRLVDAVIVQYVYASSVYASSVYASSVYASRVRACERVERVSAPRHKPAPEMQS